MEDFVSLTPSDNLSLRHTGHRSRVLRPCRQRPARVRESHQSSTATNAFLGLRSEAEPNSDQNGPTSTRFSLLNAGSSGSFAGETATHSCFHRESKEHSKTQKLTSFATG